MSEPGFGIRGLMGNEIYPLIQSITIIFNPEIVVQITSLFNLLISPNQGSDNLTLLNSNKFKLFAGNPFT